MNRYLMLVAAVVMQLCLGATYAWAVFVAPLRELTGLGQGPVQAPFTAFYVVFPLTTIVAGSLLERLGPRRCAWLGGLLFGTGWLLAGLGRLHFSFTLVGVGLLGGIGVGFAYLVPIATGILWFPRRKGLVTGIAVAGFGGGAALIARLASGFMESWELDPFRTLSWLGAVFLVVVPMAGSAMRLPPSADPPTSRPEPLRGVRSDPLFRLLYFAMFAGLAAGLTINANLRELAPHMTPRAGVAAVSWFALANAAGRIVWGWLFDRLAPRSVVVANLLLQSALLFAAPWLLEAPAGLLWLAALAGFNYGGVLVVYASAAARRWGAERVGSIYGWLFSSNAPASFTPFLAGLAYDWRGSFTAPLVSIGALLAFAAWRVGRFGPMDGRAER
jgi:OFA family oxalate/formate antiporter-like MFS transporter